MPEFQHGGDVKIALTAETMFQMQANRVYRAGVPILSHIREMEDWPNWVSYDELIRLTNDGNDCVCGRPHHMSDN